MEQHTKRQISAIEAALRNSNYRVAEAHDGKDVLNDLFCECGYVGCRQRLSLSIEDYDRVRSHPRHFFVMKGHNIPGAEEVVEENEAWMVVEKPVEVKPILDRIESEEATRTSD